MQFFFYLMIYPVLYRFPYNFILYSLAKLESSNFLKYLLSCIFIIFC